MGFVLHPRFESIHKSLPPKTTLCDFYIFSEKEQITYVSPTLQELDSSEILFAEPTLNKEGYIDFIHRIKSYLEEGESYELNFTFDVNVKAVGNPFLLYQKLKRKQRTKCSAFFYSEGQYILSLSPELFWQLEGFTIQTFPMKGTAKRLPNYNEDKLVASQLTNSEKERAENVMITDLFRNDLGKISEIGSVSVDSLFKTEAFESIWQMTSEIRSTLNRDVDFKILVENLFPSGSVTGAPKIRSIEILYGLEKRNRGIYTGTIFTIEKRENQIYSQANVAIRTLHLTEKNGKLEGSYAVGSGITILSDAESEFEECLSKIAFLTSKDIPDFEILETIRFFNGRYRFLEQHLNRMEHSSIRLGFPFDRKKAVEALESISQVASGLLRIRLLLNRKGDFRAESYDFIRTDKRRRVNLAITQNKLNSSDLFLYHKTTIRDLYTQELNLASKLGCEDVILIDTDNNVSETCLRNLFFKIKGHWYTPSLNKGGLPGTLRQKLLDKKWVSILDINLETLFHAEQILVGNSLRGLERVKIMELEDKTT